MSETELKSNNDKFEDLYAALNVYYWDNQISPDETAAKLEEFSTEVSRLVKFIRDNGNEQTRAAEHRNEAEKGGAEVEPIYVPCLNCDTARSVIAGIMQRCPNCGDDETDIWQEAEIP